MPRTGWEEAEERDRITEEHLTFSFEEEDSDDEEIEGTGYSPDGAVLDPIAGQDDYISFGDTEKPMAHDKALPHDHFEQEKRFCYLEENGTIKAVLAIPTKFHRLEEELKREMANTRKKISAGGQAYDMEGGAKERKRLLVILMHSGMRNGLVLSPLHNSRRWHTASPAIMKSPWERQNPTILGLFPLWSRLYLITPLIPTKTGSIRNPRGLFWDYF